MKVYRLSRKKYSAELSGKGAAMVGGRWNSRGTEIIYTAQSRALAMAEVAVHLSIATLPSDFVMVEIEIPPATAVLEVETKDLPKNWNAFPYHPKTQDFGDIFVPEKKACVLKVPSAVVKEDFNYLINPGHPEFKEIKILRISNFPFDNRLFE